MKYETETEKALREFGEAKKRLATAFLETNLGKFVAWCAAALARLLNGK